MAKARPAAMVSVKLIRAMPSAPGQSAAARERSGRASLGRPAGTVPIDATPRDARPKAAARPVRLPPVTDSLRVVMAHPLSLQTRIRGSRQAAARFKVSRSIPWFMAPSPKKATATEPGRRYCAARRAGSGPCFVKSARVGPDT